MTDEALIERMARAMVPAEWDDAADVHTLGNICARATTLRYARAALDVIRSEYALVSREKLNGIGSRIAAAGKET